LRASGTWIVVKELDGWHSNARFGANFPQLGTVLMVEFAAWALGA
jgi:hypothetical protein